MSSRQFGGLLSRVYFGGWCDVAMNLRLCQVGCMAARRASTVLHSAWTAIPFTFSNVKIVLENVIFKHNSRQNLKIASLFSNNSSGFTEKWHGPYLVAKSQTKILKVFFSGIQNFVSWQVRVLCRCEVLCSTCLP